MSEKTQRFLSTCLTVVSTLSLASLSILPAQAQEVQPPSGVPMPVFMGGGTGASTGTSTGGATTSTATSTTTTGGGVTVTPASAKDSLATPYFGVNMTACLYTFNWEKFVADQKAGITNTNPYDNKNCVRQKDLATNGQKVVTKDASGKIQSITYTAGETTLKKTKYKDFDGNNNTVAKTAFGETPVMGLFENGGVAAQSLNTYNIAGTQVTAGSNKDRTQLANLNSIYTEEELAKIYGPQTARTGAPRLVFTGPDKLVDGTTDKYAGGTCYAENGKMKVRTKILTGTANEIAVDPAVYGDPNSPTVACKWRYPDGTITDMVLDQNLEAYQFVYEIKYPTQEQCQTLWNIPANYYNQYCLQFYRDRIGKVYTGKAEGDRVLYTYTFYGMWSDATTQPYRWGPNGNWKNPDIAGPRKTYTTDATEAQLRAYYNHPKYKDYTFAQLKSMYEGYVRGGDGYSIYVL